MAEAFVGTFKAELVDGRRFSGFEGAEREALHWIGFYNHERLHEELGDIPPAEFEALYAPTTTTRPFGPAEAVQPASPGALADLGGTAATR
jgi:putative transposase